MNIEYSEFSVSKTNLGYIQAMLKQHARDDILNMHMKEQVAETGNTSPKG